MYTIGIDIGGTKMKAGVLDEFGKIHHILEQPTDKKNLMAQLKMSIEQLLCNFEQNIQAIGIASAGRVNYETGSILYATSNLPNWSGTNVKEIIEQEFNIPTIVDNDANCAAYAEVVLGAAKDYNNVACITLGTGVGAGIILNGQLVRGTRGGAGEFGHMILVPVGRKCNCGKNGCWEQYVSGTALQDEISKDRILSAMDIAPKELFILAHDFHPEASNIVDHFVGNLAIGIVTIHNILDLDCYVIGGGVNDSSQYWWGKLVSKLDSLMEEPPTIKNALLQNNAGMIGASQLAISEVRKLIANSGCV